MKPGRGHFLFLISTLAIVCAGQAQAQDVCTFGLDFETDPAGQPLAPGTVVALAVHPVTGTLVIGTDGQGLFLWQRAGTGTSSDRTTETSDLPDQVILVPGYPNPFNPVTTIPFELATDAHVRLTITDVLGRTIETLVDGRISAGSHSVSWNAAGRATGTYLVRFQTAGRTSTRTVALLK